MYILDKLPKAYLRARLSLIDKKIEQLPVVHQGNHHGKPVLRIYCKEFGKTKQFQYRINCNKGQDLLKSKDLRESLMCEKAVLAGLLKGVPDVPMIDLTKVHTVYNKEMWDKIRTRDEFEKKQKGYPYKDYMMDSRAEMIVAQCLDSLGLMYKYEPRIIINGEEYYPDFIVYLPEFQRCFFIEFLGKLNDDKYISRNEFKLMDYLNSGMVINRDLLLFCGYEDSMVNADDMIDDIVALIKKYCRIYS